MRRMLLLIFVILAVPAAAREDECLGHHWTSREYPAEIRYQLIMIAAMAVGMGIYTLIKRLRKADRCE